MKTLSTKSRTELRATIDDDIIAQSIHIDPQALPQARISNGREDDFLKAQAALCEQGCNPVTLWWSLRLGRAALGILLPAPPSARTVAGMVKKLRKVASDVEELEQNGFLSDVMREDVQRFYKDRGVGMEDVEDFGESLPHLDLQRWMRKKADMYERWLETASLRVAPKDGRGLGRLEYLYPAFYVREVTGKPCLTLLMQLFETVGIRVSKEQLSRDLVSLRKNYKWLPMGMKENLYIVSQRTSSMYENEDSEMLEAPSSRIDL